MLSIGSFGTFASKIFGSSNDRKVKSYRSRVDAINALESELAGLSDEALRARTATFRKQVEDGASLDSLLVPAFATVREAAKRSLGQRHYDVQMIGGMVLHEGKIAEMKTGEGKTLVATLAVYLNALAGKGVHVVTVNDYLAKRDAEWMGRVYNFLGLTCGCIVHGLDDQERRGQYACDVTYGTNNELGFDYLRDNMKIARDEMVQRGHFYSIVDEVDSILIDEARTPLIISGPVEDRADLYNAIDALMVEVTAEDFELDEKQRQVSFTDGGNEKMEQLLAKSGMLTGSLYDIENVTLVHHLTQALKAHKLFQRDKDYIVKDDQVIIIDEFTGRMMPGRRYSEGLHQALEAKEQVSIQPENQTLASITFQNYFRLYDKLAGMTGTASTEANEFLDIYSLDVIEIPTNLDIARLDEDDEIYRTAEEKWNAIIEEIVRAQARQQPVLVGTVSIEKSEVLAAKLAERGIPHQVLNARYHEQEAGIIAQAGVPGTVTIATNMAGRGTDIQLGGNLEARMRDWQSEEEAAGRPPSPAELAARRTAILAEIEVAKSTVKAAGETIEMEPAKGSKPAKTIDKPGGLYVIGTERHESRRIDNQLRGRSGRQGDPGRSKFYLSLEDDLMRIFGSQRMDSVLRTLGLKEGEAIIHPWMNKSLEMAQRKVEARNFDIRKQILKYDDVMNDQRKVIFEQRLDIMAQEDVSETVAGMRREVVDELVRQYMPENAYAEQWKTKELKEGVNHVFGLDLPIEAWAAEEGMADKEVRERILAAVDEKVRENRRSVGDATLGEIGNARGFLGFVASQDELARHFTGEDPDFEAIGRSLISLKRPEIQITVPDGKSADGEAANLGFQFWRQVAEAQSLVEQTMEVAKQEPEQIGADRMRHVEKLVLLQTLDHLWREHLVTLEHLRQVIGFRAYGQRDPLNEYKSEAFMLFDTMLGKLRESTTGQLMRIGSTLKPDDIALEPLPPMEAHHVDATTGFDEFALPEELAQAEAVLAAESRAPVAAPAQEERRAPVVSRRTNGEVNPADPSTWGKVTRNAPCPCGSGKKYKHCHGQLS